MFRWVAWQICVADLARKGLNSVEFLYVQLRRVGRAVKLDKEIIEKATSSQQTAYGDIP